MSVNFYIKLKGRTKPLHIGKSSWGWAFALHYIPGICENLEQWKDYINNSENVIYNEYQHRISADELLNTITKRGFKNDKDDEFKTVRKYISREEIYLFEKDNHSKYDYESGLWRHTDRQYAVANPEGETYDLIEGDFS